MKKSIIISLITGIFWVRLFIYIGRFFYLENQKIGSWGLHRSEFIISKSYIGLFLSNELNYKVLQRFDIVLLVLGLICSFALMTNSKITKTIFNYLLILFIILNIAGCIGIFYKINYDSLLSLKGGSIEESSKNTLILLIISTILAIVTIFIIRKNKDNSTIIGN